MKQQALSLLRNRMPRIISWAESLAEDIAAKGIPLDEAGLSDARSVGVQEPEKIRVLIVNEFPAVPFPEIVRALQVGGFTVYATTLGHSIIVRRGCMSRRLLSHECRHVYQYEQAGSIAQFLPGHLQAVVMVGYMNCPDEKDARAHELPNI